MSKTTLQQAITETLTELFSWHIDYSWSQIEELTESPIETAFAVSFSWLCHLQNQVILFQRPEIVSSVKSVKCVSIATQCEILTYRVDFLIGFTVPNDKPETLIVECDGHDFHDRTPEQASRDRARDRKLQTAGFRIFRFTGTDINRRPIECAEEVLAFIKERRIAAIDRYMSSE